MAKKSKKAKCGAPAGKKKGMKKATRRRGKRSGAKASARSGGSVAAAREGFGGKTEINRPSPRG